MLDYLKEKLKEIKTLPALIRVSGNEEDVDESILKILIEIYNTGYSKKFKPFIK